MSTPRNVCCSLDRNPNNRSEALGYRHHTMAQSEEEEHLPADDAHNETAERTTRPFYEGLGPDIRATIQTIKDLLRHQAHTADSLTPQTTDELTEHNDSLKEQLNRLVEKVNLSKWSPFWRTIMKGNATAEGDFDEMERWVTKLRRKVEDTLIESDLFMEKVSGRLPLTEHGAGEDLRVDPAGIDVAPQILGAATDAQIPLDKRLEALGLLTLMGDMDKQAKTMVVPEEVP